MIAKIDLYNINWLVHGADAHREEGRDLGAEARRRREAAAEDASVCADCGRRLGPRTPATMTTRRVGSRWLYVPICRRCEARCVPMPSRL